MDESSHYAAPEWITDVRWQYRKRRDDFTAVQSSTSFALINGQISFTRYSWPVSKNRCITTGGRPPARKQRKERNGKHKTYKKIF